MPTTDDACTLTVTDVDGSPLPTLVQTSGWEGPYTNNGTNGMYIMWDESDSGFISPRTSSFEERQIRVLWESAYYLAWLFNGPPAAVSPNNPALVVESVSIRGQVGESDAGQAQGLLEGNVGQTAYTYAILTIRYTPWISFTVDTDFGVEPLAISTVNAVFFWPDGTALDPSGCPTIRQSTAVYRVTRYDFLVVPDFTLYNGYVNSTTITIDGYSRAAGTLLMDGASTRTIYQSTGQPYKIFDCVIKYLSTGWNNFFRATNTNPATQFQAVKNAAGLPPYQAANLSLFFTPV